MGVPFEALLPYGIMLAVHVRYHGSRNVQDQTHAERREEGKTFGGSMGQAEYLAGLTTTGLAELIGHSDGSRPQIDWIPERTDRQPSSASRIRVEQPLESMYFPATGAPRGSEADWKLQLEKRMK
ncbi:unnamed protein product [Diplocarpon coronariae]|uniref:Uncharacterized protein n=1 Tax=Diplocarpon coronariae TaxID=2795749 RepID=A0A218ZIT0_9HELO|nr:hypothetical protein B2J93_6706 [Marssonina coronariae]